MFTDRREAGRQLAERLKGLAGTPAVVLALPRGGVPVAAEIAQALGLPLDLMLVRKVGLPGHRELALAAVAGPEGADMAVNREVAAEAGYTDAEIEALAAPERAEIRRRRELYLAGRAPAEVKGRTAVLVDDGIATGATVRAALQALRRMGPARIVLAVPVAAGDTIEALQGEADEVVCLDTPPLFYAVGAHYADFSQVSDDEVTRILAETAGRAAMSRRGDGPGAGGP